MNLSQEQQKYVDYLKNKIIPQLKELRNEAIQIPLTNLEWNLKKVLGEVEGDVIDIETYVQRTKADFAAIAPALEEGSEISNFAKEVLEKIEEFFGVVKPADPEQIFSAMDNPERLDWKNSVVDLIKLLGGDSSWAARKQYAVSLGYPESEISKADSAKMNMWLHRQILAEVARTGGKKPQFIA